MGNDSDRSYVLFLGIHPAVNSGDKDTDTE